MIPVHLVEQLSTALARWDKRGPTEDDTLEHRRFQHVKPRRCWECPARPCIGIFPMVCRPPRDLWCFRYRRPSSASTTARQPPRPPAG